MMKTIALAAFPFIAAAHHNQQTPAMKVTYQNASALYLQVDNPATIKMRGDSVSSDGSTCVGWQPELEDYDSFTVLTLVDFDTGCTSWEFIANNDESTSMQTVEIVSWYNDCIDEEFLLEVTVVPASQNNLGIWYLYSEQQRDENQEGSFGNPGGFRSEAEASSATEPEAESQGTNSLGGFRSGAAKKGGDGKYRHYNDTNLGARRSSRDQQQDNTIESEHTGNLGGLRASNNASLKDLVQNSSQP